jgi:uncharacterized protein with NAD-binding domain and iron-sulfur cluster
VRHSGRGNRVSGPPTDVRRKVAIIGGGPSGLTAAYWLTSTPELRARFDVTVYQMGWRLGGKGASGRNHALGDRIEEHGLHILFGFYQNFFAMIRDVYGELRRPAGAPLATWRDAFHPDSFGVIEDFFKGRWEPWALQIPRNRRVPGRGGMLNGVLDYMSMAGQGVFMLIFGPRALAKLDARLFPDGERWERAGDPHGEPWTWPVELLIAMCRGMLAAASWVDRNLPFVTRALGWLRDRIWRALLPAVRRSATAHRVWTAVDFVTAITVGMVRDRLFEAGSFGAIDRFDFREWLGRHGAHEETLWSPYTRAIYDAAFSYKDGVIDEERISAAVAVRTLARMWLTYKGAMYYKMQAGMGDTVFAPLFLVLRRRGVRFEFFHQAEALHLAEDGHTIDTIDVRVQARTCTGAPYEPLYDVKGLPCWPSTPLYEQLEDADRLRDVDLESYYSDFDGIGIRTLRHGTDFDHVVLATPVQTLPFLCTEIIERDARWRDMVANVAAVQTASFQIWVRKTLPELGWTLPTPILSVYVEPLNTWCDMTQVLKRESWGGDAPVGISYFTGAQEGPDQPPPRADHGFPERMRAAAKQLTIDYLRTSLTTLWPAAVDPRQPPALDWDILFDPGHAEGEGPLAAQYWRSNCEPHERCTLALPGTARFRIRADDSGYANLTIAGDWIDNGIHVACMEGAIMGGIYAARAVAVIAFPVIGEELGWQLGPRTAGSTAGERALQQA